MYLDCLKGRVIKLNDGRKIRIASIVGFYNANVKEGILESVAICETTKSRMLIEITEYGEVRNAVGETIGQTVPFDYNLG